MIDTVNDVVIGDVGDKIVSTAGVAVRPFWWSTECLEVLGLALGGTGTETTAAGETSGTEGGPSGDATGSGGDNGSRGGAVTGTGGNNVGGDGQEALAGSGLSGGWIALLAALAVIAAAALAALAFMIGRGRPTSTVAGAVGSGLGAETAAQVVARQTRTAPPFCSQCGSALNLEAKFCAMCGRLI